MELTRTQARSIIEKIGASGEPPEHGIRAFTAGLEPVLDILREEYFQSLLLEGLSAFKLLVGDYGSGKTHFLYCLRELAWSCNYVVSLVSLNPRDCPFDQLDLVYKEIVNNLMAPPVNLDAFDPADRGIILFLEDWIQASEGGLLKQSKDDLPDARNLFLRSLRRIESSSFLQAIRRYYLAWTQSEFDTLTILNAWFRGEKVDKQKLNDLLIFDRLDRTNAFRMIRSLCQFVREIGYNGLVLLFDEGERQVSIAGSKSKKIAFDNLRQVVDECGHSTLPGSLFCYAVPNSFKEEIKAYEALRQRLLVSYPFSSVNPSSVEINLENLPLTGIPLLEQIGEKLITVYDTAYHAEYLQTPEKMAMMKTLAGITADQVLDVSHRRLFVKMLIEALHLCRANTRTLSADEIDQLLRGVVLGFSQQDLEPADGEW